MTAEQIKNMIEFRMDEEEFGVRITARVPIYTSQFVGNYDLKSSQINVVEEVKESLRMMLMRRLFEDQRNEICRAIDEFLTADRFSPEYRKAEDNLIRLAGFQRSDFAALKN